MGAASYHSVARLSVNSAIGDYFACSGLCI